MNGGSSHINALSNVVCTCVYNCADSYMYMYYYIIILLIMMMLYKQFGFININKANKKNNNLKTSINNYLIITTTCKCVYMYAKFLSLI